VLNRELSVVTDSSVGGLAVSDNGLGEYAVILRRRASNPVLAVLALAVLALSACQASGASVRSDGADTSRPDSTGSAVVDPAGRGPFGVSYAEVAVIDPFRVRRLPLSIWYPTTESATTPAHYPILPSLTLPAVGVADRAAFAGGTHPVILFSHGSGASRLTYWYLTEALASHGFVVVAPDHVGNTFADLADLEGFMRTAQERPRDIRFLVDQLVEAQTGGDNSTGPELGALLRGHLDLDRMGIAGHSYGGYTALAASGGTSQSDPPTVPDPRIKAVAALEPLSDKLDDESLRGVRVPTLFMGGTLDFTTPIEPMVNRPYSLVGSTVKIRADIIGADHESFTILRATDHLLADPSVPEELRRRARQAFPGSSGPEVMATSDAEAIIDRYVVAFFGTYLAGDQRYESYLSPMPRVELRRG